MDRTYEYRALVHKIFAEAVEEVPHEEGVRVEMDLDDERGHYHIAEIGWSRKSRVHGMLMHCDVQGGKIYVETDGISFGIVDMLLANGVPHKDIVIGFHPPDLRKFTPFAVA